MKPVDEMWQQFAFTPLTARTRIEMTQWLTDKYPEAVWTISVNEDDSVTISPKFESIKDQTFYLLKWS